MAPDHQSVGDDGYPGPVSGGLAGGAWRDVPELAGDGGGGREESTHHVGRRDRRGVLDPRGLVGHPQGIAGAAGRDSILPLQLVGGCLD